jgi:hypothetical protein
MLKSLFGELAGLTEDYRRRRVTDIEEEPAAPSPRQPLPNHLFVPTALEESRQSVTADDGRLLNKLQQVLYVSGSPARAIREHLAKSPRDEQTTRVITLMDAAHAWAPAVIRALAEATGQTIQQLNIRDHASHTVMASLQRTEIPRRGDASLKLYHADVPRVEGERAPDDDSHLTPFVLMESSDMAAIIVSKSPMAELDDMLAKLARATQAPSWRCPTLVFLLNPISLAVGERILSVDWPADVRVEIIDEPFASPSGVWNALLGAWDRQDVALIPPLAVERLEAAEEARAIGRQLRQLMHTAGVVGCAVADVNTTLLVAGESHEPTVNLPRAAAALAPTILAHQQAALAMKATAPVEEIIICVGAHQYVVRPLLRRSHLFMFAQLDRANSNLTLARLQVAEAQRNLD